jgi:FtsZ-interacting cell division protein ZipA
MKQCPSCQQTYPDDAPDYCSNDGVRLVDEEAASFDPEKTVMASGLRGGEPLATSPPPQSAPTPQQQYQTPNEPPGIKPPTQWQPPNEQSPQQQPWQPPGGSQAPQPGWPPPSPQQQQAPNWGGASYQQPAANNAPYGAPSPYASTQAGRSRALAIAALVTGACAATIMALTVARSRDFFYMSLLVLSILGIGLGVASLVLSLQKPSRFGGVPLAIAGLATGTAALVYYFTM